VKFKGSNEISESYSVLKSDKEIKHGEYIAYFKASDFNYSFPDKPDYLVRLKGNFLYGKKNGEWIEFIRPLAIKLKGNYLNDKKVGIWETIKEDGQVIITERYDFDNKKKLDPLFNANVTYPEKARKEGIEGVVMVKYKINKDCTVQDIIVTKSLSPECDQEVIKLIKKLEQLSIKYGMTCEEKTGQQVVPFRLL
jgi:TonB family protein